MMMFEHQIRGIIALSVVLAFVPFIVFFTSSRIHSKIPVLSTSGPDSLAVEVVDEQGASGIFFVNPGVSAHQMFSRLEIRNISGEDFKLKNGMKLSLAAEEGSRRIIIGQMEAAKRLALGMPIDINPAGREDLKLIPGIGDVMADDIVACRERIGRFKTLDQLTAVKGIKEKKLSKLRPYLYVSPL
jgi:competence protein ComEA